MIHLFSLTLFSLHSFSLPLFSPYFCLQLVNVFLKNILRDIVICPCIINQKNVMARRSTFYLSHTSAGWHWSVISCVILLNWARLGWGNSCSCSQLTGRVQVVWSQVTSLSCLAAVWLSAWKMEIVGSPPSHHSPLKPRLVHMKASGITNQQGRPSSKVQSL